MVRSLPNVPPAGAPLLFAAGAVNDDAPRLLLISFHFPPGRAVGGLRWQRFAAFAAERGWELDVITLQPASAAEADPARLAELPAGTRVFGVPSVRLELDAAAARVWGAVRRHRVVLPSDLQPDDTLLESGAGSGSGLVPVNCVQWGLHTPNGWLRAWRAWRHHARERAWAKKAVSAARAIIDPSVHQAVISSGPPHGVHLAAAAVAQRAGVPLVIDLRDPWSLTPSVLEDVASPVWLRTVSRDEHGAVTRAALVITNTEPLADAMRRLFPDAAGRIVTVMNGFDDDDQAPAPPRRRFLVAYAGNIYMDRDPRLFFRAAGRLARDLGLRPKDFGVEFMGQAEAYAGRPLAVLAAEEGLEGFFRVHPRAPRREAMEFLRGAAVLLSLPQSTGLSIPAKIFEHMVFEAWLLVMARRGSATELLLRGSSADVVDPEDVEGMYNFLRIRYRAFARGERPVPLARDIRFSRRRQAEILLDTIERCLLERVQRLSPRSGRPRPT